MYSESEKRRRLDLYALAGASKVFDSQTGVGNSEVLQSLKESALEKALIVLRHDKRNNAARRIAKWAVRQDLHDPDTNSLHAVWQLAGFGTYHLIVNP